MNDYQKINKMKGNLYFVTTNYLSETESNVRKMTKEGENWKGKGPRWMKMKKEKGLVMYCTFLTSYRKEEDRRSEDEWRRKRIEEQRKRDEESRKFAEVTQKDYYSHKIRKTEIVNLKRKNVGYNWMKKTENNEMKESE
jgi:hypothetical protein